MNYPHVIKNVTAITVREYSQQCIDRPQYIPVDSIRRLVPAPAAATSHRPTVPCHICGKECDMETISIRRGSNLCGYHALTTKIKGWFHR